MTKTVLGIVGGSGFYHLPGIENPRWEKVASPWGEPSDEILFAEIEGLPFRFLPRHGRGHRLSPTHINYRANIDALKRAGVTDLISVSACGRPTISSRPMQLTPCNSRRVLAPPTATVDMQPKRRQRLVFYSRQRMSLNCDQSTI